MWIFCFGIITQSGIKAPVLCFETDGDINIEAGCDISCKVPTPKEDTHEDDCENCIDINLWNYTPDLAFVINSTSYKFIDNELIQYVSTNDFKLKLQPIFIKVEVNTNSIPPDIKTTVLIV